MLLSVNIAIVFFALASSASGDVRHYIAEIEIIEGPRTIFQDGFCAYSSTLTR